MFAKGRITTTGDVFRDEKSLAFDGSNDYVETSFVPNYTNITVSTWVKVLNNSATKPICAARDSANDGFLFYMSGSETPTIKLNGTTSSGNAVTTNVWVHLLFTWDGSTIKFYQDGILVDSDSKSGTMAITTAMEIGGESSNSYSYYGNISEVAIYSSALTINQVKTIYNGREPYNHKEGVASGNLQAWYRMGDGSLDDFNLIGDETNATLGSDLITNGGFDADSDWTKDNFSIGSGVATTSTNGASIEQSISISVGDVIKIVAEIKNYTSGSIRYYTGSGVDEYRTFNSNGVHTHYLVANSTKVLFYSQSFNGSLDNVKVYKVNGNAGTMINMDIVDIEGDTP